MEKIGYDPLIGILIGILISVVIVLIIGPDNFIQWFQ